MAEGDKPPGFDDRVHLFEEERRKRNGAPRLPVFNAASLAGLPVPERHFVVEGLIPTRTVTLISGDGATGKSLLILMLCVAMARRTQWLGIPVSGGRSLFYTAEDEKDEVHRRLDAILFHQRANFDEISDLNIVSLAGDDATLASMGADRQLVATQRFLALEAEIKALEPALVVVDTAADVFGGEEINRRQVRQFIRMLSGICLRYDTSIVLLAQPSLSGMASGSGSSGSTGWSNSVRSRAYLERLFSEDNKTELDPDLRKLTTKKANYAARDFEMQIRWQAGIFVKANSESSFDSEAKNAFADRVFLDMLAIYTRENREVSAKPSNVFAPTVFAKDPRAQHVGRDRLASAMNRLFHENLIEVVFDGPPSKQRQRLRLTNGAAP